METKNLTNGMVETLDQATLNQVRDKILLLKDKGYRVPEIPEIADTGGIVTLMKKLAGGGQVHSIPKDLSTNKRKHLKRLAYRMLMRPTWCNANLYLHFLFKKCLGLDSAPKVTLSEKEEKIQQARRAWKKSAAETEKLRVAYKAEKGDFYKTK